MTVKLFDTADIAAIADAIRDRYQTDAQMKVGEMPTYIRALPQRPVYREVWVEKPETAPQSLGIDTGIKAWNTYAINVKVKVQAGKMACPFNAFESSSNRQGVSLLAGSNKIQVYWGGYAQTDITLPTSEIDVKEPIEYCLNRGSLRIWQNEHEYTHDFTGTNITLSPGNYKLFTYGGNASICWGFFREAKIYEGETLILRHHIVPVIYDNGTKWFIDKVYDTKIAEIPPAFVTHELE